MVCLRFALVVCLASALPAAAQTTRVSVSTAGAEANGPSGPPSINGSGRFIVFSSYATNLVAGDTNNYADVFLRDRDTDADGVLDEPGTVATTRVSLGQSNAQLTDSSTDPVISDDGRFVAFVSRALNVAPGQIVSDAQIYRVDRTNGTVVRISQTATGGPGESGSRSPVISADGNIVAFLSAFTFVPVEPTGEHLFVRDVAGGVTTVVPLPYALQPGYGGVFSSVTLSADATRVGYLFTSAYTFRIPPTNTAAYIYDRTTGQTTLVPSASLPVGLSLSASGLEGVISLQTMAVRRVIASGAQAPPLDTPPGTPAVPSAVSPSARYVLSSGARLGDFDLAVTTSLGFVPGGGDFSADDCWLAVVSGTTTLVGGDANGVDDVFVIDLPDRLDADDDTMDDRWETLFNVTDPAGDPDADGQTNAQEEDAGTHPNGQVRRFLAEGATGSFFHTAIALANPSPTLAATAVLTFDRGDGTRVRRPISIPAGQSAVVDVGAVTGLETSDVSTTVESDRLLGVERSMTWGASPTSIYGSHAETATPAPSPTWFLAEGSTVLGFDLFYLLQNPQATTTHATVRYLLPSGTTIARTYDLLPGSRTTIYVNQVAGLDETDVSGDISADAPIVVERAMYRSAPGQPFALGTDSLGVPAAATSWFMAEGATGTFFDLYVLIANPGATDATVQALYAKPHGTTVTQTYTVRAHSRFSVYVDAIPGLEDTPVATTLTSTNAVPIVAERAMYWPGGFFDYYEGHSSAGSTTTALEWVVAGARAAGTAENAQTFILIANTESRVGQATLTILPDRDGGPAVGSPTLTTLSPNSRTTIAFDLLGGPYGMRVESTGPSPVQLVVESAVYRSSGGVTWTAGSNALATPVP